MQPSVVVKNASGRRANRTPQPVERSNVAGSCRSPSSGQHSVAAKSDEGSEGRSEAGVEEPVPGSNFWATRDEPALLARRTTSTRRGRALCFRGGCGETLQSFVSEWA